ncbi:hypothetical protein ALC56_09838, partial [Trachymyrmex septentrionalis]
AFSLWAANSSLFERKMLNPDILKSYRNGTHTYADRVNREYLLNTLTHEIGYALGLTHCSREDSIMFAFVSIYNNNNIIIIITRVDLYILQCVDTVLVLHHRIFVTYQRYVWSINIDDKKYDGPYVLNSYMNFLLDNFSLSAAYQRSSGKIVLFVNNMVYMIDYPSFKLKEDWPKRLSSLGFPTNTLINSVVNTNRGQTYAIFDNNDVAQIKQQFYKFNEFTRSVTEADLILINVSNVQCSRDGLLRQIQNILGRLIRSSKSIKNTY